MSLDKCRGRDLAIGKYPASFHPSSRPLTLTPFESDVCRPRFSRERIAKLDNLIEISAYAIGTNTPTSLAYCG
jgi:hypothetical protein